MTSSRLWPRAILTVLVLAAMGGAVLWMLPVGSSATVNAQEILAQACDRTSAESYDLEVTRTWTAAAAQEPEPGHSDRLEIRVSGQDYSVIKEFDEGHERADMGTMEYMEVGGTAYARFRNTDVYPKWTAGEAFGAFPFKLHPYGTTDICPDFGHVANVGRDVGKETVGSVEAHHLEFTMTRDLGPVATTNEEEPISRTVTDNWDFWIDDSGMLVQTEYELVGPEGDRSKSIVKISGVGEANTITAPAMSEIVQSE